MSHGNYNVAEKRLKGLLNRRKWYKTMDYKTTMRFLRAKRLWKNWILNNFVLFNYVLVSLLISTILHMTIWTALRIRLGCHYVLFSFCFFNLKEKQGKERKIDKKIEEDKKTLNYFVLCIYLSLYLFTCLFISFIYLLIYLN